MPLIFVRKILETTIFRQKTDFENPGASQKCGRLHQDAAGCIDVNIRAPKRTRDETDATDVENGPTGLPESGPSVPHPPPAGRPATTKHEVPSVTAQDFSLYAAVGSPALRVAAAEDETMGHGMDPPTPVRPPSALLQEALNATNEWSSLATTHRDNSGKQFVGALPTTENHCSTAVFLRPPVATNAYHHYSTLLTTRP